MNLIFDTSILIDLEKGKAESIAKIKELCILYPSTAYLSFVAYTEFLYGLRKKSLKNKEKARAFLEKFNVLHTTNKTAGIIVDLQIKHELPLADLFIAAQAIEHDCILVTKDKDFQMIKELNKIFVLTKTHH